MDKKHPDEEIRGVLDDAFAKYRKGEEKHGVLDIDTDPRNFLREAEAELLDSIVYQCCEVLRLRALDARLNSLCTDLQRRITGASGWVAAPSITTAVPAIDHAAFEEYLKRTGAAFPAGEFREIEPPEAPHYEPFPEEDRLP